MRPIRLLHISDLHEKGPRETDRWRVNLVLGTPWDDNLDVIVRDGRPVDFICFTGDIADWGLPEEYAAAQAFIARTAARVSVPANRVFVVPGNHDIHRRTAEPSWKEFRELANDDAQAVSNWLAGGAAPNRVDTNLLTQLLSRQGHYQEWINNFNSELVPRKSAHKTLGYRTSLSIDEIPFPVHIIGLDSAFLSGDDADAQKLIVTDTQVGRLLHDDAGQALSGLRIALYHHPLAWLADMTKVQRLLASTADIGLRGHLHETQVTLTSDPDRQLLEVAAGCLYSGTNYPNSVNIIDLFCDQAGTLTRVGVWVRSWSAGADWTNDNTVYKNANDGRVLLDITRKRNARREEQLSNGAPLDTLPAPPLERKPPVAPPSNARARAYIEQLAADTRRTDAIRTLRGKGIDKLASMFAAVAEELSLGFKGPEFGTPDGEAKEVAAISAPRGYLDLRRISVASHNDLRLEIVFKAAVDYFKPFPHPENEELLAEGACNILVSDGAWIVERIAIIARPTSTEGYELITIDANRVIDSDWVNNRIDILIGHRLPGLSGLLRCQGIAPLSNLSLQSERGIDALRSAMGKAIHETTIPFSGLRIAGSVGSKVGLADILSVLIARRRQLVSSIFELCIGQFNKFLDFVVRFDLSEIDSTRLSAIADIELKPVGEPITYIRYRLMLRNLPSDDTPETPPAILETTSRGFAAAVVGTSPTGFLSLDTFIKRETAKDIVSIGWNLPVVGRDAMIAEVLMQFRSAEFRVFPIVGSGGVGKTRFLAEVGKRALQEGLAENIYCASNLLDLQRDWYRGVSKSERCLFIIDDPVNASLVRLVADELSEPECRWIALIGLRSSDDSTIDVVKSESRNRFISPARALDTLSFSDSTLLAAKALQVQDENAAEEAVLWVARMSNGVPVWLLLAARIILAGTDLRDLPKDKWRLAERYVRESLPKQYEAYNKQLETLRWLALLGPLNREALPLVEYLCGRVDMTPEKLDIAIEGFRRAGLVAIYGVEGRMAEVRPAVLRDYLITSWLSHDDGNQTYSASRDGKRLVEYLAANHTSLERLVLQRMLSALGRVKEILGRRLPILDILADAVERSAQSARDAEEQLEALALASMAAPAVISSFVHAARTIRITTVPDHVRTESWGLVTRLRAEVLQSLPWALFLGAQYARTESDCKGIVEELLALTDLEAVPTSGRARNDGKRSDELIPRLISERFAPEFRVVLYHVARGIALDLRGSAAVARIPALTVISPLVSVVVQYNWANADRFVWGHYVVASQSAVGREIVGLADQIVLGLKQPQLEPNALLLWELYKKYHDGLMQAMMEGSMLWTEQLLVCLQTCKELLSLRVLSGREWFAARNIWHWHTAYDGDAARKDLALACEQLFISRPELGPYFTLLFEKLDVDESEKARCVVTKAILEDVTKDVYHFFDSMIRLVEESGEDWRMRRIQALATKLGETDILPAHILAFIESVELKHNPMFETAATLVAAHLGVIRRTGDMNRLQAALNEWAAALSPRLFIEYVYINGSVLVQANLCVADWNFLIANYLIFSGDSRWRLLGLAFSANGASTRRLVEEEANVTPPENLHEMIVGFWAGFYSKYIVEENAKRPALTAEQFEWFLELIARVPDLNSLSSSFVDDLETVGAYHPKHTASWFCSLVQERRERFVKDGIASSNGFWPVSHDRLFLAYTAPANGDDRPAIEALLHFAARNKIRPYGLSELVAEMDPEGSVVPQLVVTRLHALAGRGETLDEISQWAKYASLYPVGGDAWRALSEAACEAVAQLPHGDRVQVYWQLFQHRSGVWSGRVGEVSSKWTSAVAEAEVLLQREGNGPLHALLTWRLEQVQADLQREEGNAQEASASLHGFS